MAKRAADGQKIGKTTGDLWADKDLVTVNVFLLHEGKQVSVRVSPFARVSRVKACIQRIHGLDHGQQTLVYRSQHRTEL